MKIKLTTRLKVAFLIFLTVELIGTIGIAILEGPRLISLRQKYLNPVGSVIDTIIDAFYVTTLTITGLGADVYVPTSKIAKLFSSLLAIVGAGTVLGSIIYVFGPIFYKSFKEVSGLTLKISSLSNHVIVCGYNSIAAAVVDELQSAKIPFVIVTKQSKETKQLEDKGMPVVHGNASNSEVLESVNVKSAVILIAVEDVDTENALTVLTARHLNKKIRIIGKVESEENIEKLMNAGANEVLCPAVVGGREIAKLSLKMFGGKR